MSSHCQRVTIQQYIFGSIKRIVVVLGFLFNTPKFERWCIEEATANGLDIEFFDSSVKKALVTLEQVVTPAFSAMFDELQKTKGNT
jgi:hypothetical protein